MYLKDNKQLSVVSPRMARHLQGFAKILFCLALILALIWVPGDENSISLASDAMIITGSIIFVLFLLSFLCDCLSGLLVTKADLKLLTMTGISQGFMLLPTPPQTNQSLEVFLDHVVSGANQLIDRSINPKVWIVFGALVVVKNI